MNEGKATDLVGRLVAATTGWNDEATDFAIDEVMSWVDVSSAELAIDHIIHTWDRASRPTIGVLTAAYEDQRRIKMIRAELEAIPDGDGEEFVPHDIGHAIADQAHRAAYGYGITEAEVPEPERAIRVIQAGTFHDGAYFSHYRHVLAEFRGGQRAAQAALGAISPTMLTRRDDGVLVMKAVVDAEAQG